MLREYNSEKDSFVHSPRTGGRFVNKWLGNTFGTPKETSMTPALGQDKRCWGIIRNPFDLYASWYYLNKGKGQWFVDFLRDLLNEKIEYYWLMPKYLRRHDIGVATYCFIYFFCDYEKVFSLDKIEDLAPYIIVDKIIKYEPDLRHVIKKTFKLTTDQRHSLLKTRSIGVSLNKYDFMDYYNKELRDLIIHKDRLIFKLYPEYECNSNKS